MNNIIFNHIDNVYEIISEHTYDYKKSAPFLIDLKKEISIQNFEKDAYYYQLMATLEYFICLSHVEEAPYKNLLPDNDKINDYFQKSLLLDKDNPPLMYLFALYLYTTGDFMNAQKLFSKIDTQYYIDIEMPDRILKIKELILCCQIFLNKAKEIDIINFLNGVKSSEDYIYPQDLILTISYNLIYSTNRVESEISSFK